MAMMRDKLSILISLTSLLLLTQPTLGNDQLRTNEPIRPIPEQHGQPSEKAALGQRLFHDTRLSSDNSVSCASCHPLHLYGVDRTAQSTGAGNVKGVINTPTVYNTRYYFKQLWDGRTDSLEEQVAGPILNPVEMNSNWDQVLDKIGSDELYQKRFAKLYKDGITPHNIQDAIATFERTLITPNSSFDRWLKGKDDALSKKEKRGYRLFKNYGCVSCHQGVNVGGNMFQLMGAMGDYFADRGTPITKPDLGRFNVTGKEYDRHVFKVPSLRLAALTPPYFHDASVYTLEQAISIMARYQLGLDIPREDNNDIRMFIDSLAGQPLSLAQ
jgi:cytochrome c peroxidase